MKSTVFHSLCSISCNYTEIGCAQKRLLYFLNCVCALTHICSAWQVQGKNQKASLHLEGFCIMGLHSVGGEFGDERNNFVDRGRLLEKCIGAACRDKQSVGAWRRKRRTLANLPSDLSKRLFHRLLQLHLLSPPLIE